MKRINPTAWGVAGLLVALCAAVRIGHFEGILPLPPNAAPLVGVALLAGYILPSRALAFAVPLAAMVLGDAWIGTYSVAIMVTVYATLLVPVALSSLLRKKFSLIRLGGTTLGSTLLFFATTNLAVWAFSPMYSHTWAGLSQCFLAALPFLKYNVVGDLMWTSVLFGLYAAAMRGVQQPSMAGLFNKPAVAPAPVKK